MVAHLSTGQAFQSGDKWSYCNDFFIGYWKSLDCALQEKTLLRSLDSLSTLGNHYSNFICLQVESWNVWGWHAEFHILMFKYRIQACSKEKDHWTKRVKKGGHAAAWYESRLNNFIYSHQWLNLLACLKIISV